MDRHGAHAPRDDEENFPAVIASRRGNPEASEVMTRYKAFARLRERGPRQREGEGKSDQEARVSGTVRERACRKTRRTDTAIREHPS